MARCKLIDTNPRYTGVAAVDARHQIIVEAQAHGTGSEQELLPCSRRTTPNNERGGPGWAGPPRSLQTGPA